MFSCIAQLYFSGWKSTVGKLPGPRTGCSRKYTAASFATVGCRNNRLPVLIISRSNLSCFVFIFFFSFYTLSVQAQVNSYSRREISLKGVSSENQVRSVVADKNGFYWILTIYGKLIRWDGRYFYPVDSLPEEKISLRKGLNWLQLGFDGTPYFFFDFNTRRMLFIDTMSRIRLRKPLSPYEHTVYSYLGTFATVQQPLSSIRQQSPDSLFRIFVTEDSMNAKPIRYGIGPDEIYLEHTGKICYYKSGKLRILEKTDHPIFASMTVGRSLLVLDTQAYRIYEADQLVASGKTEWPVNYANGAGLPFPQIWSRQYGQATFFAAGNIIYRASIVNRKLLIQSWFTIDNPALYTGFYCDEKNERIFLFKAAGGMVLFENKKLLSTLKTGQPGNDIVYTICPALSSGLYSNNTFFRMVDTCSSCPFKSSEVGPADRYKNGYYQFTATRIRHFDAKLRVVRSMPIPANYGRRISSIVTTDTGIYFQNGLLFRLSISENKWTVAEIPFYDNNVKLNVGYIISQGPHKLIAYARPYLYELDLATGKARKLRSAPIDALRSIVYDPALNVLLVGTNGQGAFVFDMSNNSLKQFPLDAKRLLEHCHYFVRDSEGDYFLATNSGLFFLPSTELRNFLDGTSAAPNYTAIETGFGITPLEYNGGFSGAAVAVGDSLFFASMEGIAGLRPGYIKSLFLLQLPEPLTNGLEIDGTPCDQSALQHVDPGYRELSFSFSIPYINYPGMKLQYRVLGFRDTNWIESLEQKIKINFLPPGDYTLEVRSYRLNASRVIKLPIHIQQRWYKTRMAKWLFAGGIVAILLLVAIYIIQRARTKALLELNNYRQEIFRIIAHDLRSPIRYYQGLADVVAYLIQQNDHERLQKVSQEIDETGNRLENLLSNLFNWSLVKQGRLPDEKEPVNIGKLVEEIMPIYHKMAAVRDITIRHTGGDDTRLLAIREWLSVIIRNLVDNAIKYASNHSVIEIHHAINERSVEFSLQNQVSPEHAGRLEKISVLLQTGGSLEAEQTIGFGVKVMVELIHRMNGSLQLSFDKIDKQTVTWQVILPVA